MANGIEIIAEKIPNQERAFELMDKLFETASPAAVYSEPIEAGEYKVITASEVSVGLGYGYGGGGGFGDEPNDSGEGNGGKAGSVGAGGGLGTGGGGGGGSLGRPVAAIEIGPHGVRVEPIVDPTKIAIAFFTTLVSMFVMMGQMKRSRRGR
jgi:uncharacterized spore protein YtfJ